jgi:glycosyltransferase involved in cell wall biosynthesis
MSSAQFQSRLVSLIMPAWRPDPRWLLEAVASALAQEGCAVELILIDDGSPEPVAAWLEDIADPRLRLVRIEHGGVSRARNAGIAAARGECMRFIDADDVIPPRSTAALLAAASPSAGVTYGATLMCDADLKPLRTLRCELEGDVLVPCLLGRLDTMLPSFLFERRVVEAAGPWNEALALCEDYDFVLRAVACTSVRAVDEVVAWYRRHGASATRTADLDTAEAAWRAVIDGFFARRPELAGTRLQRRAEAVLLLDRARAYAHLGQPRKALRRLWSAAGRSPLGAARTLIEISRRAALARLKRPGRRGPPRP